MSSRDDEGIRPHGKKWQVTERDPNGNRSFPRFATKLEAIACRDTWRAEKARRAAQIYNVEANEGNPDLAEEVESAEPSQSPTLAEFALIWFEYHRPYVGQERADAIARILNEHLLPPVSRDADSQVRLGDMPLPSVSGADVDKWATVLRSEGGFSRSTIKMWANIGKMIYDYAGNKLVPPLVTGNPFKDVKIPKAGLERRRRATKRRRYWTLVEIDRVARNVHQAYRIVVWLAALVGLRRSEIFGLKNADINFTEKLIHVRRQRMGQKVKPTKRTSTADGIPASEDDVPVGPLILDVCARYMVIYHGPDPDPDAWFVVGPSGKPQHDKGAAMATNLRSALRRCQLSFEDEGFDALLHHMRACFNGLLDRCGITGPNRSRLMRHEIHTDAAKVTDLHYTLRDDPAVREATDRLDEYVTQTLGNKLFLEDEEVAERRYTIAEAAEVLGKARHHVVNAIRSGHLATVPMFERSGRPVYGIPEEELISYQRRVATATATVSWVKSCEILGVSEPTLERLFAEGAIKGERASDGHLRLYESSILAYRCSPFAIPDGCCSPERAAKLLGVKVQAVMGLIGCGLLSEVRDEHGVRWITSDSVNVLAEQRAGGQVPHELKSDHPSDVVTVDEAARELDLTGTRIRTLLVIGRLRLDSEATDRLGVLAITRQSLEEERAAVPGPFEASVEDAADLLAIEEPNVLALIENGTLSSRWVEQGRHWRRSISWDSVYLEVQRREALGLLGDLQRAERQERRRLRADLRITNELSGMTAREAARMLDCCPKTVRNYVARGRLTSVPVSRPLRVTNESVERLLQANPQFQGKTDSGPIMPDGGASDDRALRFGRLRS